MSDIRMLVLNIIAATTFAVLVTFLAFAVTCFIRWEIVMLPAIAYRALFVVAFFLGYHHAHRTKP